MILKDIKDLDKIDITELKPGKHVYVIQVQIGNMPKDIVNLQLNRIQALLKDRGIMNAILIPVDSQGNGSLSIKELINND